MLTSAHHQRVNSTTLINTLCCSNVFNFKCGFSIFFTTVVSRRILFYLISRKYFIYCVLLITYMPTSFLDTRLSQSKCRYVKQALWAPKNHYRDTVLNKPITAILKLCVHYRFTTTMQFAWQSLWTVRREWQIARWCHCVVEKDNWSSMSLGTIFYYQVQYWVVYTFTHWLLSAYLKQKYVILRPLCKFTHFWSMYINSSYLMHKS